jgi:hypothetical protein
LGGNAAFRRLDVSDEGAYFTGAEFTIDGGMLA